MTREEVVNFLCEHCHCYKKEIKTINAIKEQGLKEGYKIEKVGKDKFKIEEIITIKDFTKPLKIIRDLPKLASTETYGGVPVSELMSTACWGMGFIIRFWCYLANKQDGEQIHFGDFKDLYDTDEEIAKGFDTLSWMGYLHEREDCLEFYFTEKKRNDESIGPLKQEMRIFTPIKHC